MNLKRFLPAVLVGYLIVVLPLYIIFDYFSLGFIIGSLFSVILFAFILTVLRKRIK
ncbi:hypothetical protein [Virgibacillus halodenitrificans]|uniref:Uncharacterized protein n=1 Tax=Virgibacillus halodenitrificans TaxID=1482 RepID=A0ABR7VIY2_VIRHA|nr:hypothetical protein [Virgibacillus halodenitrificans]MBD1221896.1 hypothetical protein [Virgibacillus halodenitrificans]